MVFKRPDSVFQNQTMLERMTEAINGQIGYDPGGTFVERMRHALEVPGARRAIENELVAARGITPKSARDTVTRYARGTRQPAKRHAPEMNRGIRKQQARSIRSKKSVRISMDAKIEVSNVTKQRLINATLSGNAKGRFTDAIERGDTEAAALEFLDTYSDSLANNATIADLKSLTIEPE